MEHDITVSFDENRKYDFDLRDGDTGDITWEQAQQWIDADYVKTECEAVNPVGVALLTDKFLCIAAARGSQAFVQDSGWAAQFARCAGKATGRINITVSVANGLVSY